MPNFDNVHPFSKQTILLSIPEMYMSSMLSNHVERDFKKHPSKGRSVLRFFSISLYMRYLDNVYTKNYTTNFA